MRVLFKKIKNNSIFHSIILVLVAFVFGIFINRGISTSVTSLGLYYQELSQTLPNFEGTRFPQRILLPLLSFITNLDVQILNIIFLFLFLLSVDYYFQKKLDFLLRFLYLIGLSTTMVFQFTIIYGGYPDILSLLLYVFALKNLDNHKCYLYLFLNLLTREAAIVMLPIFFLIKGNENFINKLKNFTLLVIIYLPIYFYFEQSDSIDSNGWEFYLLPLQDDLFFWFNKSSEFYWLGLFSSVKFFLILIPFIIKSFNDILLLIISIFCINIQFIVSGGDNTRYWLLLIIPIIYLTFHNLDSNKVLKSFFVLIIILNIITPKYYVFSDAYEGSMYVRPNDSRIHFFDIQNLVFNKINFTNLFK